MYNIKIKSDNKIVPTEHEEQKMIISWAKRHYILSNLLIAIPNGGKRSMLTGLRLKKEGVMPGVSDLFLAYPNKGYHGLWIELKRRNAPPSALLDSQKAWLEKMIKFGYAAHVARGFDEAKKILEDYLE